MHIKHKFDEHARPEIFVGYPHGQKGYRIYDIPSKTIYVSRDVIFHETVFPFRDIPHSEGDKPISNTPIPDDGTYEYPHISQTLVDTTPVTSPTPTASDSSLPPKLNQATPADPTAFSPITPATMANDTPPASSSCSSDDIGSTDSPLG